MENLKFLITSDIRQEILKHLNEKPQSIDGLDDSIENTKQGIRDNLDKLRKKGWIDESEDKESWELTSSGKVYLSILRRCENNCETAERLHPFLRRIPEESTDHLRIPSLESPVVREGSPSLPGVLEEEFTDILTESSEYRGLVSSITPMVLREVSREVSEGNVQAEIVMSESLVRSIKESRPEILKSMLEDTECRLQEHGEIPFNLSVFDGETVVLSVGNGYKKVMVELRSEPSVRWADRLVDNFKQEAVGLRA